jgi:hypothetical protein
VRHERFLDRVQRTGADIAEHHADGTRDQTGQADAAVAVAMIAGRLFGQCAAGRDGMGTGHGPTWQGKEGQASTKRGL